MASTDADRALAQQSFNENGRSLQACNDFLDQHELEFPEPIREMVSDLRRAMQLPASVVGTVLPAGEVMRRSDAVTTATERIRAEVRQRLG